MISGRPISNVPISFDITGSAGFTETLSDSFTISDTFGSSLAYVNTLSDSFTLTDTFSTNTAVFVDQIVGLTLLSDTTPITTVDQITLQTLLAETNVLSSDSVAVLTLLVTQYFQSMSDTFVLNDMFTSVYRPKPVPPAPPQPVLSSNIPIAQSPYQPVPTNMQNAYPWNQLMARTINQIQAGGQNTTLASFTLTPNATSTILYMSQIGGTSVIQLTPLTADAAATSYWITNQGNGQATINHNSSPQTDRTFSVSVVG